MKNLAVTVAFCIALLFIFVHCRKQEKQLSGQITRTSSKSRPIELNLPDYPVLPEPPAVAEETKTPPAPAPVAEVPSTPAPAPAPEPVAEVPSAPAPEPAPAPAPEPAAAAANDKQAKINALRITISQKKSAISTLEKQLAEDRIKQSRINSALSTISDRLNSFHRELKQINEILESPRYICYTNCIILGSVKFERLMVRPKVDVPNGVYHIRYYDRFRNRNYRRRNNYGRNRPAWEREHDPNYYRHPKRFEVIYECLIHKLKWVREQANDYHERYPDRYAQKAKQNDLVDKIKKLRSQQNQLRDEQKNRNDSMETITRQIAKLNREIMELEKELASLM